MRLFFALWPDEQVRSQIADNLQRFDLDKNKLPEIVPPSTIIGNLSDFIVEKTGLDKGGHVKCS